MKTTIFLTILLFSNLSLASFRARIIPHDTKIARSFLSCETKKKCRKEVKKWFKRQSYLKGKWTDVEGYSIAEKTITDVEGNEITKYLHPIDFDVKIKDMKEENDAQEVKNNKRKALIEKLKKKDLNLKQINELLRSRYE